MATITRTSTLREIAAEGERLWNAARAAGNPNHSTIRNLACILADIAQDGIESERDDALALLAEAEALA